ncbi:MAG: lycopene cyclase family protein [Bacteroidota bacterium]
MKPDYDYILTGGGCAGLSLVYQLLNSPLKDKRILLLDKSQKLSNDKTWCYWAEKPYFPSISQSSWENLIFRSDSFSLNQSVAPLSYYCIHSLSFYQEMHALIASHENVEIKQATVLQLEDLSNGAMVHTTQGNFTGRWVFNSIIGRPELTPKDIFLKQHFWGWKIKAQSPLFDPSSMTLMDFGVTQNTVSRFVYILPFSPDEALIEFTVFSQETLSDAIYQKGLMAYMEERYPGEVFEILEHEKGVIPMTNYRFPRTPGKHILNLGTAGGFTKATTGYTFKRIQEDVKHIVDHLTHEGIPRHAPKSASRFAFYDDLLLYIIQEKGESIKPIFEKLFRKNRFQKILSFLDEESSLKEDLYLLGRLPWSPFLKAIYHYYIRKSWKGKKMPTYSNKSSNKQHLEYTA